MKTRQKKNNCIWRLNQAWLAIPFIITAVLFNVASSNAQTSPNGDWTDGFDNDTSGAQDSTASWIYWYNGSGTVSLDTTVKESGAGSLEVTIPFDNDGETNVGQGAWFGNFDNTQPYNSDIVYDGTQFTNIIFDILMDPSDQQSPNGDYGVISVGLLDKGTPGGARSAGQVTIPATASNTWFHVVIPVDKTASYLSAPGVIGVSFTYSKYSNTYLTNTIILHIDNLLVQLGAVSNPPPVMSIKSVTPGLNFVQGSISGQFDRQNIITANGASSTANYSWAGATAGSPVTYSFTISKYAAPDLNYHIYFYQTANAGSASAPDYNQPDVLIFQVSPLTNNPAIAVASLTWKTNSPNSGTTGTAITVTNSIMLGAWQLQFTSATAGTIFAPGGNSYPFSIDPSLAVAIANPITVNFGINPAIDTNTILGETVVVSQIGIAGVDPLSTNYSTMDNFLADSTLDPATWTVNALFPGSILFVTTNDVYSVNWTLPAIGFSLEVNSSLNGPNPWVVPSSLSSVLLFPGMNTLVDKSSLPPGNSAFFRLAKLTATQLQVLLPGETNAPGTLSGKIGTPTPQSVSTPTTVTVNAVDANWNIVSLSDTVQLSTSDGNAFIPGSMSLVNGTATFSGVNGLLFQTQSPPTMTVTATDEATGTIILPGISSPVVVGP